MTTQLTPVRQEPATDLTTIERVVVQGDLGKLSAEERWSYYLNVCRSLGLNPFTRPFEYVTLSGRLVLYARKDCAEQLRKLNVVSVDIVNRERMDDIYVVTARATMPDGRHDEEIGAVTIGNLKGDALANALMKATTKAKRRVTLSICGLGMLDETEIETIPEAKVEDTDALHGRVTPTALDTKRAEAAVNAMQPAPAKPRRKRPETREEWIDALDKGFARAQELGIDVATVDTASLSDEEVSEVVLSLGQQIRAVEAALKEAQAPAEDPDAF